MRKKVNKKLIVALLSFVLLFGGTFGSSLAWLLDTSDDVANTFTTSDINIELKESDDLDLKMIPGHTIEKDPEVTVIKKSEDCWVFVKITEDLGAWDDNKKPDDNDNPEFADYLSYDIADGWTRGDGGDVADGETPNNVPTNVIFRQVKYNETNDQTFGILDDDIVTVSGDVTKEMMEEIEPLGSGEAPSLTFIAYASQLYKAADEEFTAEEAWELVKDLPTKSSDTNSDSEDLTNP